MHKWKSPFTDTRLQLLLIAFSFGAFFEGASGFGTPVAVTAAILIGLGFRPLSRAVVNGHYCVHVLHDVSYRVPQKLAPQKNLGTRRPSRE